MSSFISFAPGLFTVIMSFCMYIIFGGIVRITPISILFYLIIAILIAVFTLFVFADLYFMSIIILIIYIGAIMLLFIFVIMMFNFLNTNLYSNSLFDKIINKFINNFIICLLLIKLHCLIYNNMIRFLLNNLYFSEFAFYQFNNLRNIILYYTKDIYIFTNLLYTKYGIILIFLSIIMLIGMFGSLVLVRKINNKTPWKTYANQN